MECENTRTRCVVLFGAGASFGSSGILPVPPPLGADLYGVLARAFPKTWGGVSGELKREFETHFEIGMGELWSMYPLGASELKPGAPSPHRLMQDMARLFLSYNLGPGEDDLYSKFLIRLSRVSKLSVTCMATLNYEHLLKQAMIKVRLAPRVLRPHGGCQFWMKRGGRIFAAANKAIGQGMHAVSSRIRILVPNAVHMLLNKAHQVQYPCMANYVESKVTQMGQRYLVRVQDRFKRRVLSCKKVVLVGVRPWPSDKHVWDGIFETNATILYVGSRKDFRELQDNRRVNRRCVFVAERFEDVVDKLIEMI